MGEGGVGKKGYVEGAEGGGVVIGHHRGWGREGKGLGMGGCGRGGVVVQFTRSIVCGGGIGGGGGWSSYEFVPGQKGICASPHIHRVWASLWVPAVHHP